jgi:hypothetical protein
MQLDFAIAGLVFNVAGALLLAVADAWLSRSMLIYLDAVEDNLSKVVESVQGGGTPFAIAQMDRKRDRGQNRARSLKLVGWAAMALGFVLMMIALRLGRV